MRFDIIPHIGAGKIKFGMTRDEIQAVLGKPEFTSQKSIMEYGDLSMSLPTKDGYFKNELQITFDDNDKADFIEFSGKDSEFTKVFINEIEIFNTPAKQLIKEILNSTNSNFDTTNNEIPYSYIFSSIDLAVWRQVIPALNEEIEEIPDSDEGKYFWTIGIGIKGYYK